MRGDFPANPIEKSGYILDFQDEFDAPTLNLDNWLPYYLPQWSSRAQTAPRYMIEDSKLVLQIEANQQPWCPEFDGDVKVSSLQTGVFSGAEGTQVGQHRFNEALLVREAQSTQRTYTPQYGYFEVRAKASALRGSLSTLWMIGFEDEPEKSGGIDMFELFGEHITPQSTQVSYGIYPWSDPHLSEEAFQDDISIDARQFHIYALEWSPTHVDFYIDNIKRRTIHQSPAYPMQFMLGTYELPIKGEMPRDYPKRFEIDYVRGYQPIRGY